MLAGYISLSAISAYIMWINLASVTGKRLWDSVLEFQSDKPKKLQ